MEAFTEIACGQIGAGFDLFSSEIVVLFFKEEYIPSFVYRALEEGELLSWYGHVWRLLLVFLGLV